MQIKALNKSQIFYFFRFLIDTRIYQLKSVSNRLTRSVTQKHQKSYMEPLCLDADGRKIIANEFAARTRGA